jgi:hypothetical protein
VERVVPWLAVALAKAAQRVDNGDGPPSGRWSAARGHAGSSIVFGEADPPSPKELLPADLAAFVLFFEPAHQRLEVFHHRARGDVFAGGFL